MLYVNKKLVYLSTLNIAVSAELEQNLPYYER